MVHLRKNRIHVLDEAFQKVAGTPVISASLLGKQYSIKQCEPAIFTIWAVGKQA